MKKFQKLIKTAAEKQGKVLSVDCSKKSFDDMRIIFPDAGVREVNWLEEYTLVAYLPDEKKIHISYDPDAGNIW